MPTLTRWFLKAALAWLVAAALAGAAVALQPALDLPPAIARLRPAYVHMLMVGWVTQLIFGIAHWMFPKPTPTTAARTDRLGWLAWLTLNVGLVLRVVAEPAVFALPPALLATAAVLQPIAAWLFVAAIWPRVRVR